MHSTWLKALSMAALAAAGPVTAAPRIEVGEPFPDLLLPSVADGSPMSVEQFRGQKVILQIWASW